MIRKRSVGALLLLLVLAGTSACTASPSAGPSSSPTVGSSSAGTTPSASPPSSGAQGSGDRALPTGAPTASASPGSTDHSIESGGRSREYILYVPQHLPAGPVPLVVMLHGGSGSAQSASRLFGWNRLAEQQGFAVVYPNGLDRSWAVGGDCCGPPARQGVDDAAFVTDVVRDAAARVRVDPRRVYATGISEGAMLAYRLACDTTLFAAVGPDAGTLLGDCPSPAPVSVIDIHGTADPRIRYDGAQGAGRNLIDGPPIPALDARWRAVDGCSAPSVTRSGVVTRSTASCPDGRTVEYIALAGAGHVWPGIANARSGPDGAIDATTTLWAFFAAHPKP